MLQLAQKIAGIGTWEWHIAENRCYWSESMGPLFGLPLGANAGNLENFLARVHPDDRPHIEAAVQRSVAEDAPYEIQFRVRRPDGSERWLRAQGRMLRDEPGKPLRMVGAAIDITDQMRIEQARQSELNRTKDQLRGVAAKLLSAQEEERARIARELHDDLAQELALVEIELTNIAQKSSTHPETREKLKMTIQRVSTISAAVRDLSHTLHPALLDDFGLLAALRQLVHDYEQAYALNIRLRATNVPQEMPARVAMAAYRITQEALRNVAKHAGGALITISLSGEEQRLRLRIKDTGPGFNVAAVQEKGGLGLVSMQERALGLGGRLRIRSKPGYGTKIIFECPIADGCQLSAMSSQRYGVEGGGTRRLVACSKA